MKSIMQNKYDECFFTHVPFGLEEHHVMNGSFRKKAEKYGLKIRIHYTVHRWLHDTKSGRQFMYSLKAEAQKVFEKMYSHDKWMGEFKKDYSEYSVNDIKLYYTECRR